MLAPKNPEASNYNYRNSTPVPLSVVPPPNVSTNYNRHSVYKSIETSHHLGMASDSFEKIRSGNNANRLSVNLNSDNSLDFPVHRFVDKEVISYYKKNNRSGKLTGFRIKSLLKFSNMIFSSQIWIWFRKGEHRRSPWHRHLSQPRSQSTFCRASSSLSVSPTSPPAFKSIEGKFQFRALSPRPQPVSGRCRRSKTARSHRIRRDISEEKPEISRTIEP